MLRQLRGRLNQVQGEANETMALAQDLIADLKDGFALTVTIKAGASEQVRELVTNLVLGKDTGDVDLPLTIKIDPEVDA